MDITIEIFEKAKKYWLEKLSGELSEIKLFTDFPRVKRYQPSSRELQFPEAITKRLIHISNNNESSLYVILVTVFKILLFKLTGQEDIIISSPTLKKSQVEFNQFIALRDHLHSEKSISFKELLIKIKQTVEEAYKHQHYPIRKIIEKLGIGNHLSLFRVIVLLENIHEKGAVDEIIKDFQNDIIFAARKEGQGLEGKFIYNEFNFTRSTIERIGNCFLHILSQVLNDYDMELTDIQLVSEEEKRLILFDFNNTNLDYPEDKTIHGLFAEQVEKTPDHISVVGMGQAPRAELMSVTYRQLNRTSQQLAQVLREKGIQAQTIVAIMSEPSVDMIIGLLGIMKAGGAYLPIDPGYPTERINYILADSSASVLVTTSTLVREGEKAIKYEGETIIPGLDYCPSRGEVSSPTPENQLAYVIYTSGSTGRPKGVMIEHRSIVNTLSWRKNYYRFNPTDVVLQIPSFTFDSSVEDIFTPLISGSRLVLIRQEDRLNLDTMQNWIKINHITHFLIVPSFYKAILEEIGESLRGVKFITIAGESVTGDLVNKHFDTLKHVKLYNEYGPTENSVCATVYPFTPGQADILIGKPIDNVCCYILNANNDLSPMGIPGQLFISGKGLARGYLNHPQLTAEKFCLRRPGALFTNILKKHAKKTSFWDDAPKERHQADREWVGGATPLFEKTAPVREASAKDFLLNPPQSPIYMTGDMARWMPDGNIEFLGRVDFQVKISGHRIELGEIENQLLKHRNIKEAVVIAKESGEDKFLCAFYVLKRDSEELDISEVLKYMGEELPDYMVPSFIECLDKMPLTPHGKVDRKALESIVGRGSAADYLPPRNKTEETLAAIWAEILGLEKDTISIDANFFELGGQSLKATILVSRIHKELNTKISLQELFMNPVIRELARSVQSSATISFTPIKPAEEKEYYVMSPAQNRLYIIQQTVLASTVYNVPHVYKINEKVDKERFRDTFAKLMQRHESLRTSFEMISSKPVQKIHEFDKIYFKVEYHELPGEGWDTTAHQIIKRFIRPFDLSQAPLLRLGLIKLEETKCIFMTDLHHIISDGVSEGLLIRDFISLYNGEELPKLKLQYKDYSQWLNSETEKAAVKRQEEYWLKEFDIQGEIPVLNMPYDFQRTALKNYSGKSLRFYLEEEKTKALNQMALEQGTTLFMVTLTIFYIMLAKMSGQEDIIVGTVTVSRRHADLENIIGMFVNLLALRNYPNGKKTFLDFLEEVETRALKAFENQEYPFEDLVDNVVKNREISQNPLVDVVFSLENIFDKDETNLDFNLKLSGHEFEHDVARFDLSLYILTRGNQLLFSFEYDDKLFTEETVGRFFRFYREVISTIINEPGKKISEIEILPGEEKRKLLLDFNDTKAGYPLEKTIHELFTQQVERTPGNLAVVGPGAEPGAHSANGCHTITYQELNEKSNELAHLLRAKGVKPNTTVGIMAAHSLEMIIGLMGILKAGAAFLPIDPQLPENRVRYMLNDCRVPILLTSTNILEKHSFTALQNRQLTLIEPGVRVTGVRPQIIDLDHLPVPDRSLVDYDKYSQYIGLTMFSHTFSLQATRGCPYNCAYCHKIWPKKHIIRSPQNIFSEVLSYYNMGVRRFAFIDDIFNLDRENSTRFFELIIENNLEVQLFFPNGFRGDILTKEYIDLAVKAGTVNIALSLETASPRLQKLIRKNINVEKLEENIKYICETYPHVILELQTMHGFPTETKEEARETLDFMKRIKWIHFPYLHILKIYPNTDMAGLAVKYGVSTKAIEQSAHLAYHDLPDTLPFEKDFTLKFQAEFLNDYFLSRERLLHVLPYQLKQLTKEELVQKYDSYLSTKINRFEDLLQFIGIREEELGQEVRGGAGDTKEKYIYEPGINERIKAYYPPREIRHQGALRLLLLDLSQFFSSAGDMLYDVVEPPLGLMYLLTYLNQEFPGKINGRIAKSKIDFDNYSQLKALLEEFKPEVIGVRSLSFYKDFLHKAVSLIRQWGIQVPVIAGGPYATSDYHTILNDRNIDLVVRGEGEITFAEVIEKIMQHEGKLPPTRVLNDIAGIVFIPQKEHLKTGDTSEIIMMDEPYETGDKKARENLANVTRAHDLSYVIYTSGSTGNPNGVMVEHRSLVNLCYWHQNCYSVSSADRATKYAGFGFDASVWEIFPYLLSGASLFIPADEIKLDMEKLGRYFADNGITISFLPTQVGEQFMKLGNHGLQKLLVGGDKLRVFTNPGYPVYNNYGPTENTVVATACQVLENAKNIPIGAPIHNNRVYILSKGYNQLQPIGLFGELCIAGASLARGYGNNPEKTIEKFTADPFVKGERMFNTGDLARWLPDGNIEFLGRIDNQVKIRGNRIELGEIEQRLLEHTDIQEVLVLAKQGVDVEPFLCAYLISQQDFNSSSALAQMKEFLLRDLPDYMVPTYFVTLKEFPLTPNGKIDVKALPDPVGQGPSDTTAYNPPGTEIEKALVEIWEKILGRKPVGINDDFFMIGGDSIKSIQIAAMMNERGYKIEIHDIIENPTISQLAPHVKPDTRIADQSIITGVVPLTPIQKRFFKTTRIDAHHLNQAMMFYSPERLHKKALERIFTKIQEHHDMLRVTYKQVNEEIIQQVHGIDYPLSLQEYDLRNRENQAAFLETKANEIQASIDLENGPLMKIGLFHLEDSDRLLIVIHHLVIDGVSWRILFNDIETLYQQFKQGEPFNLPLKTDSFKLWSQQLMEYANSEALLKEKVYWQEMESQTIPMTKRDYNETDNYIKDAITGTFRLSKNDTDLLLSKANEAYGTEVNDLLLTGLGLAFRKTFGHRRLVVALEGHGREAILENVDISRTVGWFTTIYPVSFDISYENRLARQIKENKEVLRQVPNRGIGYGILRYLTSDTYKTDSDFKSDPQISFNYLGQFDADVGQMSFEVAKESVGGTQSPAAQREYEIEISVLTVDKQLSISIRYNKNQYKANTIETLLNHYKDALIEIVSHCSTREERELTPSDFTYDKLSIEDIQAIDDLVSN
jgi:amino acid adenylation domain-containing protein/non-ribosomal peptide synthase protein (TIGR01720 family)